MADVNKTIEISMTADLKSLQKQLSKIPGMTKEEAKAMTKALQRELKQAQAAAKKTAQVNKRAMAQVTKANNQAARSAKNLRTQSREMGAAFGSLEDVVGEVSPELAGLAMTVGTVGQGFRALSRSMATGNPLVLALVASVAALAAGYHILTSASREAEQRQKDLAKAAEQLNDKLSKQRDIANEVVSAHRDATLELEIFTGQISELDAEILKARDAAGDQLAKQLEKQDEIISAQEKNIELAKKAESSYSSLTDEEKEQLRLLMNSSKLREVNNGMASTSAGFGTQMALLQTELNEQLAKETGFRAKIETTNKQTLETRENLLRLQEEYAKEQREEAERQEQIAKAREAALKRQKDLQDAINESTKSFEATQGRIDSMRISRLADEEQINANAEKRKEDIQAEIDLLMEQFEAAEKIARTQKDKAKLSELDIEAAKATAKLMEEQSEVEKQRLHEVAELRKKLREDEQKEKEKADKKQAKEDKEALDQYIALQKVRIQAVTDVFAYGLQLAQETGNKNKDLINVLFRANQAASLANVVMSTAEAIAAAPAQYGPLAPLAIPAIVASGAVQAGVVLSQTPPLHMGGIVQPLQPDEQNRTLLTGEAVLDRATTRRLGEDGINRLQNGKSGGPDVIVMSPFKHLDRYNRSALRNPNSSFSKMKPTRRSRY
jgi:DNA repair exonuclease SbcCD ATPase subunit